MSMLAGLPLRATIIAFGLAWLALVGGCQRTDALPATTAASVPDQAAGSKANQAPTFKGRQLFTGPHRTPKGMKGLGIVGYNYTDTYIDSFAVNGAGGGNISVSSPTSGGHGVACCAFIGEDMLLPVTVEISWRRDGDAPLCKQTVLLDGPVPAEPNYLEVHFYQDGTIQLAITDSSSPARIVQARFSPAFRHTDGNVDNDYKYCECKPVSQRVSSAGRPTAHCELTKAHRTAFDAGANFQSRPLTSLPPRSTGLWAAPARAPVTA